MIKFLDKKVQQVNVLDERFYTDNTKDKEGNVIYYPSVTTVLDVYPKGFAFAEWLRNNGQDSKEIVKEAARQGSVVHNSIDDYIKGSELKWIDENGKENYTLLEWKMLCRFVEFFKFVDKTKPFEAEQTMLSHHHRLGGTTDLVCDIDGETWLIDYKSSNAIHTTNRLQLAVYKAMYEKLSGKKIDRYGVLWLKAQTRTNKGFMQGIGWQIKEFTKYYDRDIKLFKATRTIWDEENPNYKPKNLAFPNVLSLVGELETEIETVK